MFQKYTKRLHSLFMHFSGADILDSVIGSGSVSTMNIEEWLMFCSACKIMEASFDEDEARSTFIQSLKDPTSKALDDESLLQVGRDINLQIHCRMIDILA